LEKISLSKIECEDWLGELLSKYRKKHNLETWKDTLHGLVRELLEKAEKPAEAQPSNALPVAMEGQLSSPMMPSLPQQAQPPPSEFSTESRAERHLPSDEALQKQRDFMKPSQIQLAYMKQKARDKAKLEGMKEREEWRKQVKADRYEREYYEDKKRREERELQKRRSGRVTIEQPNSGPAPSNPDWA
jgi:hypothetical protein